MKLYYSKGACSLAIHIVLHEMNLPCEYIAVNLANKKTEQGDDFLMINPKGAVPSLVLKDGTVLTENVVIQQYLADTYQANTLLPPLGDLKRYLVLAWLNYATTDLHKSCSPFFNPNIPSELKEQVFKPIVASKLEFLNQHFANHAFAAGAQFSLADGYIFTVLRWMPHLGLALEAYPHVLRFFNTMKERPSVAKAMKEEGLT